MKVSLRVAAALVVLATIAAAGLALPVCAYAYFPTPVLGDTYTIVQTVRPPAHSPGTAMAIQDITTDASGNLWAVTSDMMNFPPAYGSARLAKYTSGGVPITSYGAVTLVDPQAVKIGPDGMLYVLDPGANRIVIFNPASGGVVNTLGGPMQSTLSTITDEPGHFDYPSDIVFDSGGNLYVADQNNHRIQKFNSSHQFVTAWGIVGGDQTGGTGGFYWPSGLCVDGSGNILVADAGNNRIVTLSSSGAWLNSFRPTVSGGSDKLQIPMDVYVDVYGTMYIVDQPVDTDYYNGRLIRFGDQHDFLGEYRVRPLPGPSIYFPTKVSVNSYGEVWLNDRIDYGVDGVELMLGLNAGAPDVTAPVTLGEAPYFVALAGNQSLSTVQRTLRGWVR